MRPLLRSLHIRFLLPLLCVCLFASGQTAQESLSRAAQSFADKDFATAVRFCNAAFQAKGDSGLVNLSSVYKIRGMALVELDSFARAVLDFTECIQYDSMDQSAWYLRGNAYFKLNESARAISDYQRCIAIGPGFAGAYLQIGRIEFTQKEYAAAILDYTKYIQLEPGQSAGYVSRGMVYLVNKQKQEGCADLQKAALMGDKSAPELIAKFCK